MEEALLATKQPCSQSSLYRHIAAEKERIAARAKEETAKLLCSEDPPNTINLASSGSAISSLTSSPTREMRLKVRRLVAQQSWAPSAVDAAIEEGTLAGVSSFASAKTAVQNNHATVSAHESSSSAKVTEMKAKLRKRPVPIATSAQANYNNFSDKVQRMSKKA